MFNNRRKRHAFDESVDAKSIYRPKPMVDPFEPPEPIQPITDAEDLAKAYAQGDTYKYGKTLYIAGSHTIRDWYDVFTKIPFHLTDTKRRTGP